LDEKKYDVVIIGSGMGGLSSALILAKNGFKVCVLEKNQQIGGNLQIFSRDKCVFDTGVHYIGGLDEGENLHTFFKYFDIIGNVEFERLDDDCFDKISFKNGKSYKYAQGYDNFIESLVKDFPNERVAIERYCELMQETCDKFPLYNVEVDNENSYLHNISVLEANAYEVINSLTTDQTLRNVLAGNNGLYAGVKEKTPFYVHALVVNSYIKGAYRVVNGGSEIVKHMVKSIRSYGGDVFKRQNIVGANYDENNLIESVYSENGDVFRGDKFISNLHPAVSVDLFGENRFLKAYRNRIKNLENTISSFIVHVTLEKEAIEYKKHNEYYVRIDDIWDGIECNKDRWPEYMFICSPSSKKKDKFAESLSLMVYMDAKDFKEWEGTFNTVVKKSERTNDYHDFKKHLEQKVIDAAQELYPNLKDAIKTVYSSSPLTFRDYLNNPDGNLYGLLRDSNNPSKSMINPKTKVKNLYLTGQNIVFHGVLGVVVGAFVTCFELLDKEKLIKDVRNS
jgi:all-trans-retinol 13,14-reductase